MRIFLCSGIIIWAKLAHFRDYYLGQVFFETLFVKKRGFNIFKWVRGFKKNWAQNFPGLFSGPNWPFLNCNKLGPGNNPYLAQVITPQDGVYVLKQSPFHSVFEHQPKFGQKWAKTIIKTWYFCFIPGNPQCHQKIGVLYIVFLKDKNIDVEQKHKLS